MFDRAKNNLINYLSINQSMILMVFQLTCWIGYNKQHILHHINRISSSSSSSSSSYHQAYTIQNIGLLRNWENETDWDYNVLRKQENARSFSEIGKT